jgi:UDP-N-acetylmuramoyl-tripeptide--D-alanyl-D-alanine ligase
MFKKIITKILVTEARWAVKRSHPVVVGITGSVGKSSTKEAIATVLGARFSVRKSKKSYNSELGLSLAILGLETAWKNPIGWIKNIYRGWSVIKSKNVPAMLVLEMGVDRPKDMDALTSIVRPTIAVVTPIGDTPVHVEFFPSAEDIAREKSKILKTLTVQGHAILNSDDEIVLAMKEKTNAHVVTYGFGKDADIKASNYQITEDGISFKVDFEGASVPVRLRDCYGKHHVYPALAAMAVGSIFGLNLIESAEALQRYSSPPGRLCKIKGIKSSTILDDSYNASPLSVHAALDTLRDFDAERKIFVFGDMLELGRHTIDAHKAVGMMAAESINFFVTIGPRTKFAAEEAIKHGLKKAQVVSFSLSSEAAEYLKNIVREGDLILVKGSQGMRTERVVEELMAHPEEAPKTLCRQDDYWKKKK